MSDKGALALVRAIRAADIRPPPCKLVAFVMASYANIDGTRIRPSKERVARECGTDVRNVRRHVEALKGLGVLTCTKESKGRKPAEYRMNLDALNKLNPDSATRVEESGLGDGNDDNPGSESSNPGSESTQPGLHSPATCNDLILPALPARPRNKRDAREADLNGLAAARSAAIGRYLQTKAWSLELGPPPTADEIESFKARAPPPSAKKDPAVS